MADVDGNEMLREHGKNCSFAKKSGVFKVFEPCLESFCRWGQDQRENKTVTSCSEKQNAVLTLPRDPNYNSCRTQNSSGTEFGVGGCGGFLCWSQPMTRFEEAMG
jgi:hypothetical protein